MKVLTFPRRSPIDILRIAARHDGFLRWVVSESGAIEIDSLDFPERHKAVADFVGETVRAASEDWRRQYLTLARALHLVDNDDKAVREFITKATPGETMRVQLDRAEAR